MRGAIVWWGWRVWATELVRMQISAVLHALMAWSSLPQPSVEHGMETEDKIRWARRYGFFRWLLATVTPVVHWKPHIVSLRWFGMYVARITGPYTCAICGRPTTMAPDLEEAVPAHCARRACFQEAWKRSDEEVRLRGLGIRIVGDQDV